MEKEEIGLILKRLRLDSGKTQKEVAELLGRSQQVVGHWETGYAQPDANTLFLLCSIYDADMNEAFGFGRKTTFTNDSIRNYSGQQKNALPISNQALKVAKAFDIASDGIQESVCKLLDVSVSEGVLPSEQSAG